MVLQFMKKHFHKMPLIKSQETILPPLIMRAVLSKFRQVSVGLCSLAELSCFVLTLYSRRQPGEAELVLLPQCTDAQEEGKCAEEAAICSSFVMIGEGQKEIVLAMLPLFCSTSVDRC